MHILKSVIVVAPLMAGMLTACSPEYAAQEPAAASASSEDALHSTPSHILGNTDLSSPLSLVGTEPFWGVKIADGVAILSRIDLVEASYSVGDFVVSGTTATLKSGELSLTLTDAPCSDGMSDRNYPLTAEVRIGEETLKGCAIPTAALTANTL